MAERSGIVAMLSHVDPSCHLLRQLRRVVYLGSSLAECILPECGSADVMVSHLLISVASAAKQTLFPFSSHKLQTER